MVVTNKQIKKQTRQNSKALDTIVNAVAPQNNSVPAPNLANQKTRLGKITVAPTTGNTFTGTLVNSSLDGCRFNKCFGWQLLFVL
jgi:hypothetical protein